MFQSTGLQNQMRMGIVLLMAAFLGACARTPGLITGDGTLASSTEVTGFDQLSSKIFQPKCLACHSQFASYEALMESGMIRLKNPEASPLYLRVANASMPTNGPSLSERDVNAIYSWISAGSPQATISNPVVPGLPVPEVVPTPTPIAGGGAPTTPTNPTTPPTVQAADFASIQAQVLTPRCVICHREGAASGGYDLSSYNGVMAGGRVLAGNPAGSRLLRRINDNSMPPGGPALSQEVKAAIAQWIQNGALNDAPVAGGGSDTTPTPAPTPVPLPMLEPTFQSIMANIIAPRCLACHTSGNAKGGVNLSTYANVVRNLSPGNASRSDIYKEVEDNDMPESGSPLSFQQKETLRQWIDAGALNN